MRLPGIASGKLTGSVQSFTVGLVMLVSLKDEDPPDFVRSQSDSCPHRDLLLCRGS
jgi:hypothetical protein